jgi:hypothetical protein
VARLEKKPKELKEPDFAPQLSKVAKAAASREAKNEPRKQLHVKQSTYVASNTTLKLKIA